MNPFNLFPEDNKEENKNDFNEKWDFVGELDADLMFLKKIPKSPQNPPVPLQLQQPSRQSTMRIVGEELLSSQVGDTSGYTTMRTSHFVEYGNFYFEVDILRSNEAGKNYHTRVGVTELKTPNNMPVGYNEWSFGYRDYDGQFFYDGGQKGGKKYGEAFTTGDTVGIYLSIPEPRGPPDYSIRRNEERVEQDNSSVRCVFLTRKPRRELISGSFIAYYKNGTCQGVAKRDLPRGKYHPAASLFRGARVKFNFGPKWKFPPEGLTSQYYLPYCSVEQFDAHVKRKRREIFERESISRKSIIELPQSGIYTYKVVECLPYKKKAEDLVKRKKNRKRPRMKKTYGSETASSSGLSSEEEIRPRVQPPRKKRKKMKVEITNPSTNPSNNLNFDVRNMNMSNLNMQLETDRRKGSAKILSPSELLNKFNIEDFQMAPMRTRSRARTKNPELLDLGRINKKIQKIKGSDLDEDVFENN